MLITCPSCSKKYEIDSNAIPETGRKLRCYNCSHLWFFHHPEQPKQKESEEIKPQEHKNISADTQNQEETPFIKTEIPIQPLPSSSMMPKHTPEKKDAPKKNKFFIFLILFLTLISAAGLFMTQTQYHNLPYIEPVIKTIKEIFMGKNNHFEFNKLPLKIIDDKGIKTLIISTKIKNISNQPQSLSPIRFDVLDKNGNTLHHKTIHKTTIIQANKDLVVSVKITKPNPKMKNIKIYFVNR